MANFNYPFSALVGQDEMQLALILNAINPSIGGVLIRGEKGTAKSTAVRALVGLLPQIEAVEGCPFAANIMLSVESELASLKSELTNLITPYRRADQSVQVERGEPVAVYDLSKRPVFCIAISEIVGLYDELMMFWYLDRVRGVISAGECHKQANKYKKKIRTMMYIGMKYRDYKFRGTSDRTSIEWSEAVKQFGEPSTTSYRSRYYKVPA